MNEITIRRPLQWLSSSATDMGTVRKMNEDAVLSRPEIGVWVVADGMGGHEAGNIASRIVVEAFTDMVKPAFLDDLVTSIETKLHDANSRLLEYSEIMLEGRVVGSTFVCLAIHGQIGVCLWAGDSRLYRYRNNQLTQLSRDHSYVAELLEQGSISPQEALNHPEANVITRAIGTSQELYIDLDVFSLQLGDIYLLCSDGLYNAIDLQNIIKQLSHPDLESTVKGLIDDALSRGAADNVSAIVVKGVRAAAN
ncbi:MAG: serine/threonine-protein phosphatase [Gammaproteobacteria bacterium]|nr:serine/threonine-protein phosphatase [Gammaproteobacteria bacterium]